MYTIKDLCVWYNVHPNTMSKKLVELGVLRKHPGRGNRKRLTYCDLKPVFNEFGRPVTLALTDNTAQ